MEKIRLTIRPVVTRTVVTIERRGNAVYRVTKICKGSSVSTRTERIG